MNAAEIAKALGAKRHGQWWQCRCPAHEDSSPSFSFRDGDRALIVKCFSGCDKRDIFRALRNLGLAGSSPLSYVPEPRVVTQSDDERRAFRVRLARRIWDESQPAQGTIVETYLRSRGYDGAIPDSLRYNQLLRHPSEPSMYPGMVAAVTVGGGNEVVAIHRTFLKKDGFGKADIELQKAMLGDPLRGAVQLAPAANVIGLAEGIENGSSFMQQRGIPVWATTSASLLESIILPGFVRHVIIGADRDKPSKPHPRGHGLESAERAAERFIAEGRTVEIVLPPDGVKGFNDVPRRRMMPQP
jgi:putative DNA primase/helicase